MKKLTEESWRKKRKTKTIEEMRTIERVRETVRKVEEDIRRDRQCLEEQWWKLTWRRKRMKDKKICYK